MVTFFLIASGIMLAISVTMRVLSIRGRTRVVAQALLPQYTPRPVPRRSVCLLYGGTFTGNVLIHALAAHGIRPEVRAYSDLVVDIIDNRPQITERVGDRDLASFGVVQIHGLGVPAALLSTLATYLSAHHRTLVNGDDTGGRVALGPVSKLHQYVQLALAGENIPDTHHITINDFARSYEEFTTRFGTPFIIKPLYSSGGAMTELIATPDRFTQVLMRQAIGPQMFLAQRYIPNNGTFLLIVLGGNVPVVIHRCSTDGSHITSRRQASHATLFEAGEFEPEVKATAVRCAALFGYELAAVTMVQNRQTRTWSVLSVDGHPNLGDTPFAVETGRAYAAYMARRLGKNAFLVKGMG